MAQSPNETKNWLDMITISCNFHRPNFALQINETIPSSGITAIFGRSGAGKTTVINAIAGLVTPNNGRISINDRVLFDAKLGINLAPEKRAIGFVFQDARLFPHMTVERNLRYGVKGASERWDEILQLLALTDLLKRYPHALSGGEKQRVAIGRALLTSPSLLIMDEPTASLDKPRREELMGYLQQLTRTLAIPLIYISHQLDEILQLADHMLLVDSGKVIANGAINDVWRSASMQPWISRKEQSRLLNATVISHHPDYHLTALDLGGEIIWTTQHIRPIGSHVRVRIYATDVSITKTKATDSSIRNCLAATILALYPQADKSYCQVELAIGNGNILLANITQWAADELHLAAGMAVFAQLKGISITQTDISLTAAHCSLK